MLEEQSRNTTNKMSQEHAVNIGALLVDARNHAGLSQNDIANQINLPLGAIQALERNELEKLPEPTYVRGYLRLYAQIVGIDAKDLVNAYNEQYHVEPKIDSEIRSKSDYGSTILWGISAIATVLVGLLAVWWVGVKLLPEQDVEPVSDNSTFISSNPEDEATIPLSATRSHDGSTRIQPEDEATMPLSATVSDIDNVVDQTDVLGIGRADTSNQFSPIIEKQDPQLNHDKSVSADAEQVRKDEALSSDLVALNKDADVLTVTYTETSWTEINDADLNLLIRGLIEPGAVKNLIGKAPFYVFLGNSSGVVIEFNGQYFDHAKYKRSNRTAKFQVSGDSFN